MARHLGQRVEAESRLELLAPVILNIVCFRYRCAAPSTTVLDGRFAIRAAIVNRRVDVEDVDTLVTKAIALGDAITRTGTS